MKFKLTSKFKPTGEQPQAIEKLTRNLTDGAKHQVLLGVTGSGKTATMAWTIERIQKPTLIISHNKTLAWQLYQEFKEFFPENAVHYFVSYYDYYQPEAYIPQTDTYIEKDAKINEEIDRMRHAATQDLLSRNDVIVVASVSCIYNIGSPKDYQKVSLELRQGQKISRKELLTSLVRLQYQRNDIEFKPGIFRTRGETVEIYSVTGEDIFKIDHSGNQISQITKLTSPKLNIRDNSRLNSLLISEIKIYPAHFWVTPQNKLLIAIENIKLELQESLKKLKKQSKHLEAERLQRKTNYDLEMLKETGWCHGIENYSRHLEFRSHGDTPYTLLDYFLYQNNIRDYSRENSRLDSRFLVFIDESHMTIPQVKSMYTGDRARKETLIKYGFRLPSALDNRPLKFNEFEKKVGQTIYVSATPGPHEMREIQNKFQIRKPLLVEQLIRPTGLLEPSVEVKPTKNQVKDLIKEIKKRVIRKQRTLVITLTKRMAEDLAEYLLNKGIKTNYLHSEVKTLQRPKVLRDLRLGNYDVIVGINLLREGLDLPEVTLIAIFDADKEGFLRNKTTLIQTMGRAARHLEGHVILYADRITDSMKNAIDEVSRRRKIQEAYNKKHGITPRPIVKPIRGSRTSPNLDEWGSPTSQTLKELEKEMKKAAQSLDFERAAEIRDLIKKLKNANL